MRALNILLNARRVYVRIAIDSLLCSIYAIIAIRGQYVLVGGRFVITFEMFQSYFVWAYCAMLSKT